MSAFRFCALVTSGRARLPSSRILGEGETPVEPHCWGGRDSCRAASFGSARLPSSRILREGETPIEPPPGGRDSCRAAFFWNFSGISGGGISGGISGTDYEIGPSFCPQQVISGLSAKEFRSPSNSLEVLFRPTVVGPRLLGRTAAFRLGHGLSTLDRRQGPWVLGRRPPHQTHEKGEEASMKKGATRASGSAAYPCGTSACYAEARNRNGETGAVCPAKEVRP